METQIQFKLTKEDKIILQTACKLTGITMSNLIRFLILKEARKILLENNYQMEDSD